MSSQLIIDARRSLPWRHRFASDAGTAGLWAVWLLLSAPGLVGVAEANPVGAHPAAKGHELFAATSIEAGIALVALVALALTVWRKLAGAGARQAFPKE